MLIELDLEENEILACWRYNMIKENEHENNKKNYLKYN